MITFNDLKFVYDGNVLFEHFYEKINTGEKVVITGASGRGKSTLLNSIAGFVIPNEGEVYVDNLLVNEHNLPAIRAKLAWVPQEYSLPYQDVSEMIEVLFHLKSNRMKKPTESQVVANFASLGLSGDIYRKRLTELSGGQRQRVMIAIAALLDKDIILLDEPTSALDPESVDKVIRFLREMEEKTIVAVSHDATFAHAFDFWIEF